MPRFSFKSSSSSNAISLNSPREASSSRSRASRDDRQEQSRKDKESKSKKSSGNSRRRNFGFLGIGKTEKSSDSRDKHAISKRREHAKQLANLAYSDEPTSIATTTTSQSTNDSHFAYNMSNQIVSPVNNNNSSANTSFFAQQQPKKSGRTTTNRPRTNSNKSSTSSNSGNSNANDAFGADPFASFDAFGMSSSNSSSQQLPQPSAQFSDQDFSELDFFATQMAGATTPVYSAKGKKKTQPSPTTSSSSKPSRRRKSQPVSLDRFFDDDSSSFTSGNDLSTIDNDGGSSNSAAQRRRMRSHMNKTYSNNDMGSGASVAAGASSSLARSKSSPQMPPPGSPGIPSNKKRSKGAALKNGRNNGWPDHSHQSPHRSTGSSTSSTANYSSSSPRVSNLFDSDDGAGFTFDAFGLDESQVEREVNSAMKDIMGNGGFSIFDESNRNLESGSDSGQGSGNNSVASGGNKNAYFRQDSFSGHQSDASSEAQSQWESSPNPSRKNSREFHSGNELDSFGASPATPSKPPVQLSSVQKRRLQRSASRGVTTSTSVTPPRGNKNNNSNNVTVRQIVSEPPKKTKQSSHFDPWQEDPFASPESGGRFSDPFANDTTARKLYSETQSDVQDYYASGGVATAANSFLNAEALKDLTPSNKSTGSNNSNYARTDIGVSGRDMYFQSPKSTRKSQEPSFELPPEENIPSQSLSDDDDDFNGMMQDDLAHEFAKDLVRRMSPTNQSQGSHHSSRSKKSAGGSVQSYRTAASNRKIQYGNERIDDGENDDHPVRDSNPQHSPYKASQQKPAQPSNTSNKSASPSTRRFSNFRTRYEKSRSASSASKTPTASNVKSDLGTNSYHGSTAQSRPNRPEVVSHEPKAMADVPKWQQSSARSGEATIEEKKEEEVSVNHRSPGPSPPPRKTNSLRARWEAKTRAPVAKTMPAAKTMPPRASPTASEKPDPKQTTLEDIELVTPEIVEHRRQARNEERSDNLRKSMGVTDPRPKPVVQREPPPPVGRQMSYRERREMELRAQREREEEEKATETPKPESPEKNMNHKERRDMELKLLRFKKDQDKAQEPPPQAAPTADVASLIRQRISANKRTNSPPQDSRKEETMESPRKNPAAMLENMFAARAPPVKQPAAVEPTPAAKLDNFLAAKNGVTVRPAPMRPNRVELDEDVDEDDAKSVLSGFFAKRSAPPLPIPKNEYVDDARSDNSSSPVEETAPKAQESAYTGSLPALKDDPKFERYFRMLKMGLPLDVAKHAMVRDGLDPDILDKDPNKPIGIPVKDDPKYEKYFKMLKIGIPVAVAKHAMERDGLNPAIMDQDHNLPAITTEKKQKKIKKETHRRARLHWKSFGKILKNSLWDTVQSEVGGISIDEEEFADLFQADLKASKVLKTPTSSKKKGVAIRVIDPKRASNGGIILARVKLTHDQMADAVDKIDSSVLTAEQIEGVIEYLPTKEERDALEKYMLEGGQDAAEKFDGLCECEKFMVSMMTVKHAKRKVRALLFKLQFLTCMESIAKDAAVIDTACDELINSNRLRQLLGIILQFGNRLNTAGNSSKSKAGGFSLESLSKLSEAKAFDKKTTFLHYIILILERNNELLLKFYDDIPTVLVAENVFWDQCQQDLEEVENQLENVRRIALHEARSNHNDSVITKMSDDDSLGEIELTLEEEVASLRATQSGRFSLGAIKQVSALRDKIDRTRAKCLRLSQYFGVTSKNTEPQEIFSVFVNFASDFKKAKEQVFSTAHKRLREDRKKARQRTPKKPKPAAEPVMRASSHQPNMNQLFGDIKKRQPSNSASIQDGQNDVQSSRAGLLSSIKERQSPTGVSAPSPRNGLIDSIKQRDQPAASPMGGRAGLMDSIKQRNPPAASPMGGRAGLMDAIKQRPQASESPIGGRAGLMDAIKQRPQASESPMGGRAGLMDGIKQRPQASESPMGGRAGLMDAIKQRNPPPASPIGGRAGLMDAIKQRPQVSESPMGGRAGLMDAIKQRPQVSESSPAPASGRAGMLDAIKQRQPPPSTSPTRKPTPTPATRPTPTPSPAARPSQVATPPSYSRPVWPPVKTTPDNAAKPATGPRTPREAMRNRRRRLEAIQARNGGH